jgi:hypothetical protein
MKYPNDFYYSKTVDGKECSTIPSGKISVNDLIQGLPYWITPNNAERQDKRHLLISDYSLSCRSFRDKDFLANQFAQLIEDGFSVSIDIPEGIHPLQLPKEQILKDFERYRSLFRDKKEIIDQALSKKTHFTQDNIYVLGNYDIEKWLMSCAENNAVYFEPKQTDSIESLLNRAEHLRSYHSSRSRLLDCAINTAQELNADSVDRLSEGADSVPHVISLYSFSRLIVSQQKRYIDLLMRSNPAVIRLVIDVVYVDKDKNDKVTEAVQILKFLFPNSQVVEAIRIFVTGYYLHLDSTLFDNISYNISDSRANTFK